MSSVRSAIRWLIKTRSKPAKICGKPVAFPTRNSGLITTTRYFPSSISYRQISTTEYQCLQHDFTLNVSGFAFSHLTATVLRPAFSSSWTFCLPRRFRGVTTTVLFRIVRPRGGTGDRVAEILGLAMWRGDRGHKPNPSTMTWVTMSRLRQAMDTKL